MAPVLLFIVAMVTFLVSLFFDLVLVHILPLVSIHLNILSYSSTNQKANSK